MTVQSLSSFSTLEDWVRPIFGDAILCFQVVGTISTGTKTLEKWMDKFWIVSGIWHRVIFRDHAVPRFARSRFGSRLSTLADAKPFLSYLHCFIETTRDVSP